MRHEVACSWKGGMAFEASIAGHVLRMDADEASGGGDTGLRPKPLLLAALAGCTGMDVVSILGKMREPLSRFEVVVEAELAEEHPRRYLSATVAYRFLAADGLDRDKVEKAVALSREKYCGVEATLSPALPISFRIEYS